MPQVFRQKSTRFDSRGLLLSDQVYKVWVHSPRASGSRKLILQGNPYDDWHCWYVFFKDPQHMLSYVGPSWELPYSVRGPLETNLLAQSYAKFRGKLYKDTASLGVTLASWKQSQDMIVKRYQQLASRASAAAAKLLSGKRKGKQLADFHLEVIFGWMPLVEDIHHATVQIAGYVPDKQFIRASVSGFNSYDQWWEKQSINMRITRAAGVVVSNENLWLLERLGLLNPASVAWDLVPWSFVVNMFVNTGQIVNSLTDFAGLSFERPTITTTSEWSHWQRNTYLPEQHLCEKLQRGRVKVRTLDGSSPARPPMIVKIPGLDFGKIAIASSLFSQKAAPLWKLLPDGRRLKDYTE